MWDWRSLLDRADWRQAAQAIRPYAPGVAIAAAVCAAPLLLLYLIPPILGLFAPKLDPGVDLYAVNRPLAFTFLDATGAEVGHRGAVVGERLKLEDMPAYLPAAFIAMEDRRFYYHNGIDPLGLGRALLLDLRARHWVAGGSTISQQTAKIVYTNQQRTMSRKLTELIDAAGLEKSLTKREILQLYLNRIYLGSAAYGVDGAARVYFGTSARQLTLAQAAMLATLTRAPSVFSPRRDLLRAQQRASLVLDSMVDNGAITESQAEEARAHPAQIIDRASLDARNYFLDSAADEATRLATVNGVAPSADMLVHTTLEPKVQEAARLAALRTITKFGKKSRVSEAAVVIMKPDGAVSALIGGVDYRDSVFNRATQAHRQPGSAFKPFVYLTALEAGMSPWETRDDEAVDIGGYKPTNFGGKSYGTLTLAEALAHSVNTITVNLAQEVGVANVVATAKRVGITSPLEANASLALGTNEVTPMELTAAYAAFANGGYRVSPYLVSEVDIANKPLYQRHTPPPQRVIGQAVDRDLTGMLFGVVANGTGGYASLHGREAAGKTGTTQDSHDAWFVGFTTDYVAAAWVGNDDSSPTRGVTGGTLPAYIWRDTMLAAEQGMKLRPLDRSVEPPPEEPQMIAAGTSWDGRDDESLSRLPTLPAEEPQQRTERRHRGGLLGWLFGDDDDDDAPPPPRRNDTPRLSRSEGRNPKKCYKAAMIRRRALLASTLLTLLPRSAAAATTIRFVTDWKAQAEHGGFYQAVADGLYAKRGLDVKIIQGGPDVNVPQLLAGGAADFGMGSNSFICLNLVKTGVPLRAVMAIFQKDPQVLISHPRRDINSLADMRGKPILISAATMSAFWPWLRAKFGFSDTQIRKYTYNLAPFITDPNAIQEGYLTSEPFTVQQQAHFTPKIFLLSDYGYPGYANMVLVPQKWIDTNRKAVQLFVDATRDGWLMYLDNPAKGNALIKRDNPDITDAILRQAWDKMKQYELLISGDGRAFGLGSMTDGQWKLFYDTMAAEGLYPKGLDYKKAYDLSFGRATLQKYQ